MSTVLSADFLFRHHMREARLTRQVIRGARVVLQRMEKRGLTEAAERTKHRLLMERARLRDHVASARSALID